MKIAWDQTECSTAANVRTHKNTAKMQTAMEDQKKKANTHKQKGRDKYMLGTRPLPKQNAILSLNQPHAGQIQPRKIDYNRLCHHRKW